MIEDQIFDGLTGNAGVAAIVGTRVYPHAAEGLPQRAQLPAVTYQAIGGVGNFTYEGRVGLTAGRFQINCFGRTLIEADAACRAVLAAFSDTSVFPGFRAFDGPRDLSDPQVPPLDKASGARKRIIWRSMDVQLWHQFV